VTGQLHISDELALPAEAVTQTFAVLAKRGAGKTYTAAVMTEQMVAAGHQVVVVDPVGVWWGLRSSATGEEAGLPVVILGGDHADVPLEESSGEVVADLVVDEGLSCVLDLSLLRKGAQTRLMTAFAERLYHRNRRPLHLVVDEADAFAPQRPRRGGERLLGAIEDLVRRGRARGIGVTLITQRSAVLNKNVLTQIEVLVVLRTTGPQDRAAVDEWLKHQGEPDKRAELLAGLPSLPVGTAYVWSPGWLGLFARVAIRTRRTFDSSSTPDVGAGTGPAPTVLADVDLDALAERLAASIERAKADDPAELRRRIGALERQLRVTKVEAAEPVVVDRVEVPILDQPLVARLEAVLTLADDVRALRDDVAAVLTRWEGQRDGRQGVPRAGSAGGGAGSLERPRPPQRLDPARRRQPGRAPVPGAEAPRLKAGARRILDALARHHPMVLTRAQAATLAGLKVTGGTFTSYWSTLKTAGLIEELGGEVGITDAGLAAAGVEVPEPMGTDEVLDMWRGALKRGAREMLDALVEVYPDTLSREKLAEVSGIAAGGGTFGSYLSSLRRNGLVEVDGRSVRASPTLFLSSA
jgi:hypothetical protein